MTQKGKRMKDSNPLLTEDDLLFSHKTIMAVQSYLAAITIPKFLMKIKFISLSLDLLCKTATLSSPVDFFFLYNLYIS